jgi:RNA recognition motif-containing protein
MSKSLYVGNLAPTTTDGDLREAFGRFGSVASAAVVVDRETRQSRGFAFVEMANGGEAAIQALQGTDLNGKPLKVNEARPHTARRDGQPGAGRRSRFPR